MEINKYLSNAVLGNLLMYSTSQFPKMFNNNLASECKLNEML